MAEGGAHKRSVRRLKEIGRRLGGYVMENDDSRGEGGWRYPMMLTDKGPKQWTADALIWIDGRLFDFESDGKKGHSSTHNYVDDTFRDAFLYDNFGIITIRYNRVWIHTLKVSSVKSDIDHALKTKENKRKYLIAKYNDSLPAKAQVQDSEEESPQSGPDNPTE